MIRMEYPKANIEGLSDREKIYALKKQLDTLTNNVQLVLESIDGDLEGINEYIGGVPDELDNSMSTISKRVDEVETAVGTLEERDYIVEEGTSGIWTYRKWNSGIAECWAFPKFARASMTNRSNSFYTTTVQTITFPTDLFINNPTVIAKAEMGNYLGDFAINRTNRTNTTGYIWCETSRTQDIWVHIHAIGRWK